MATDCPYEKSILTILLEVGSKGIRLNLLAMQVYNLNCSLFEKPDLSQIKKCVNAFVRRNCGGKKPMLQPTGKWGCYRIKRSEIKRVREIV